MIPSDEGLVPEAAMRALFDAFAGPPDPVPAPPTVRRRTLTRRTLVAVGVAAASLAVGVPGSLALLRELRETPRQFVADANQPANARRVIERYLARTAPPSGVPGAPRLTGLRRVVLARTPEGVFGLYALDFRGGATGLALISSRTGGVGVLASGPPVRCPDGWALEAGVSMVERPRSSPAFVTGRVASRVASVEVRDPSGRVHPAALANGYFVAWGRPSAAGPVRVVARDAAGRVVGAMPVSGDARIPRRAGAPADAPSCW